MACSSPPELGVLLCTLSPLTLLVEPRASPPVSFLNLISPGPNETFFSSGRYRLARLSAVLLGSGFGCRHHPTGSSAVWNPPLLALSYAFVRFFVIARLNLGPSLPDSSVRPHFFFFIPPGRILLPDPRQHSSLPVFFFFTPLLTRAGRSPFS